MSQILINKSFNEKLVNHFTSKKSFIEYHVENDKLNEMILVLPTERLVRREIKNIVRYYFNTHKKSLSDPEIYNFQNFTELLFSKINTKNDYRLISDSYRLIIIEEAFNIVELKYYKSNKDKIKYTLIQKISDVINGLKEDGIEPENLEDDISAREISINNKIDQSSKLKDIYEIYNYYENYLEKNKLLDKIGIIKFLVDKTNDILFDESKAEQGIFHNISTLSQFKISKLIPENTNILFSNFSDFKYYEIKLLCNLQYIKANICVNLNFKDQDSSGNYYKYAGPFFGNLTDVRRDLLSNGYDLIKKELESIQEQNLQENLEKVSSADYFAAHLFNNKKSNSSFEKIKLENFNIVKEIDEFNEVNSITKLVKYLIEIEKISPKEICISTRKPELYATRFRQAFLLNNIPSNIAERYDLSTSGIIVTIFQILEFAINKKKYNFEKILYNPFFKFNNIDKVKNAYKSLNQKYNLLSINLGDDFIIWINILEKFKVNITNFIESEININSNEGSNKNELNIHIKHADVIIEFLKDLSKFYSSLIKSPTIEIRDLVSFINKNLLENFKVADIILSLDNFIKENYTGSKEYSVTEKNYLKEEIEQDFAALMAFKELLAELQYIEKDNKPYKLAELVDRLKLMASSKKFNIKEKNSYGVNFTSIEQTRGISYQVMILCGAKEGIFPLPYKSNKFLGMELKSSEKNHYSFEKMLFYDFLLNDIDIRKKKYYAFFCDKEDYDNSIMSNFLKELLDISVDVNIFTNNYNEINHIIEKNKSKYYPDHNWQDFKIWTKYITSKGEKIEIDYKNLNLYSDYKNQIKTNEIGQNKVFDKDSINILSVSSFDELNSCSYKYLVNKIYKLKNYDENDSDGLTSLDLGNLLHDTFKEAFYSENDKYEIKSTDEIINIYKQKTHLFSNFGNFFKLDIEIYTKSIEQWYKIQNHLKVHGFQTIFIEKAFEFHYQIDAYQFKFKGRLDRIDYYIDNQNDGQNIVYIVDYKSKDSDFNVIKLDEDKVFEDAQINGTKIQLALYTFLLNQLQNYTQENEINIFTEISEKIGNSNSTIISGFIIFPYSESNKDISIYGDFTIPNFFKQTIKRTNDSKISSEELLKKSEIYLEQAFDFLNNGSFPTTFNAKNLPCKYCNLQTICRVKNFKNQSEDSEDEFEDENEF